MQKEFAVNGLTILDSLGMERGKAGILQALRGAISALNLEKGADFRNISNKQLVAYFDFTKDAANKITSHLGSSANRPVVTSSLSQFFNFEGASVRVVFEGDSPWFVAADACRILEIGNAPMAVSRLDDDEKGISSIDTPGGDQQMTIINESGLYSLIMTSRKPEAKRFKKWVTSEVLPSIRKKGGYGNPMTALSDPATMRSLLLSYSEKVIELQPKADALDLLSSADGSFCLTDAAKSLQVPPHKFCVLLQYEKWIYRRPGNGSFIAYQTKIQAGYLIHKITTIPLADGSERISEQVRVTPKGMAKLATMVIGARNAAHPS